MSCEIVWSRIASVSLNETIEFLKKESRSSASRIKAEIGEVVSQLSRFPLLGPVYERDEFHRIREVLNHPFRIFYRVYPKRTQVVVLLIWHVSRDEPDLNMLRLTR